MHNCEDRMFIIKETLHIVIRVHELITTEQLNSVPNKLTLNFINSIKWYIIFIQLFVATAIDEFSEVDLVDSSGRIHLVSDKLFADSFFTAKLLP